MMGERGDFPGYAVKDSRWWARRQEATEPAEGEESKDRSSAPVGALDAQLAEREAQLAERDQQLREARVREREAVLELDRARARLERDARREIERGRRDLLVALLPVLDDLDRAIAAAKDAAAPDTLVKGVELVRSGFLEKLRGFGIERFEPTPGEEFDPNRHEALSTQASGDAFGRWLIARTLRPGYLADNETIRPAQVVVAREETPTWPEVRRTNEPVAGRERGGRA